MFNIDVTTYEAIFDDHLISLRPHYLDKDWEVYMIRNGFVCNDVEFSPGMVLEVRVDEIFYVYETEEEFWRHLVQLSREESGELPAELELAARLGLRSEGG